MLRYLNEGDIRYAELRRDAEDFIAKYPHRDLWHKPDALMKWFSIIRSYETLVTETGKKVIDLGSGEAPVCHYISDFGNEVVGVDIQDVNHLVKQSLVKMVLKDAWLYMDEQEDESVDVFIDSCAVTHFSDYTSGDPNGQWVKTFAGAYRTLKPGGYFIISSDVNPSEEYGEYISPQKIIEYALASGLKLQSEPDYSGPWIPPQAPYAVYHFVFVK